MSKAENNGEFKKGTSGNPAGRPRRSRNQARLECEHLLQAAAPDLTKVLIEEAKKGNMPAMRLCVERMYPTPKEQPLQLTLPAIESGEDLLIAYRELTRALADGQISAAEGQSVVHILTSYAPILATADHDRRLTELERHLAETRTYHEQLRDFMANSKPDRAGESLK
jgi:hypothetical protein